jgi:hypothetical protein
MPKFHAQNLLSNPLSRPELPPGSYEHHYYENDEDQDYLDPVRTLLSWNAPSRPYRKKDRSFYTTVAILIILTSLIAWQFWGALLVGALLSLGFLVYVLNFIAPTEIEYKISTQGLTIGEHFYHWQQLDSFWFSDKDGHKILNVLTRFYFPALLIIVIGETPQEDVKRICARYLPFHEIVPKSTFEKWAEKLQKHFPLENPHK